MRRRKPTIRAVLIASGSLIAALAAATGLVALLEHQIHVPNASSVYLLSVILLAVGLGTVHAVLGALGGFLLYDYFFVQPLHDFAVFDPGEWLNLLLLLVVGLVVGQLAGRQRQRAEAAEQREREARGFFEVSRAIAVASGVEQALQRIVGVLRDETGMSRVWVGLAGGTPLERVVADTGVGVAPQAARRQAVLQRRAGEATARWIDLRTPGRAVRALASNDLAVHRVPLEVDGRALGSLWALRPRAHGAPSGPETRLLSVAADQIGQAVERDRLQKASTALELSRQSDALKSALVDSVSHDFRTPLATIRAAAGRLLRSDNESASAAVIDRQAAYLDRLVSNLLDLSRIEAGALRPNLGPILLDDVVRDTIDRLEQASPGQVVVDVPASLPPVLVDEVHLDAVLTNLLENARTHAPGMPVKVRAERLGPTAVRLTVEDGGPGVEAHLVDHLFEKFYRGSKSRRGSGIGLAVVRGLTEAGGGRVAARRSEMGGLAVDVDLPIVVDAMAMKASAE